MERTGSWPAVLISGAPGCVVEFNAECHLLILRASELNAAGFFPTGFLLAVCEESITTRSNDSSFAFGPMRLEVGKASGFVAVHTHGC